MNFLALIGSSPFSPPPPSHQCGTPVPAEGGQQASDYQADSSRRNDQGGAPGRHKRSQGDKCFVHFFVVCACVGTLTLIFLSFGLRICLSLLALDWKVEQKRRRVMMMMRRRTAKNKEEEPTITTKTIPIPRRRVRNKNKNKNIKKNNKH